MFWVVQTSVCTMLADEFLSMVIWSSVCIAHFCVDIWCKHFLFQDLATGRSGTQINRSRILKIR
uniref:AlNc14C257G9739 protein n=1 Tax=Albugo laibachii Nc14 TaxID=890382 RepID=F0WTR4_9STRA|nr:AlNc14C257G9739 [Albugo laibachii Nc14]|eukprot:CCA24757.1 AlNc14C257G9739 [Albugo laibachii Nc14]